MDDPVDIMKEFVGLIALVEVDNWAGMLFELYLETFHEKLLTLKDYLVFETDFESKAASYYYTLIIMVSYLTLTISGVIDSIAVHCPRFDEIKNYR